MTSILDLGDSGNGGYHEYVWPVGVNDSAQVTGNVYFIPKHGTGQSYTRAFFWDTNAFSLIDSTGLSANTQATALNSVGSVVGLYGLGYLSDPFNPSGGFFWDGITATSLGSLAGSGGASVFALDDSGMAFGTSLDGGGQLRLFNWADSGGVGPSIHDLGSVSLFAGDQSFAPITFTAVLPWGGVVSRPKHTTTRNP